jgi:hypothetical protein
MIKYLNLPPLPPDLVTEIDDYATEYWKTWQPYGNELFEERYPPGTNLIKRFVISPYDHKDVVKFFYKHLGCKYAGSGIILIENQETTPAIFPPHTDYKRNLGLNYVIRAGGAAVETITYLPPAGAELKQLTYWNESELVVDQAEIVQEGQWYIFNAQKPHAVKNIETCRVILMVYPDRIENQSIETFMQRYSLNII